MKCEKSCGCIVIKNEKVLMIQQNSGFYGFPKGHMEGNETEMETAVRETKEETNIDAIPNRCQRYKVEYEIEKDNEKINKEVIYFLSKPLNENYKPQNSEVRKIKWVPIKNVEETLTFDNMKDLWYRIKHDIK